MRYDGRRSTEIRAACPGAEISDESSEPGPRKRGDTRSYQNLRRCRNQTNLGAAILGVGGDEVIHVLLDAMYAKAPYTVIQRAMHIHPTVAEFLPVILGKLGPFM